jgi:cation transport ATPase
MNKFQRVTILISSPAVLMAHFALFLVFGGWEESMLSEYSILMNFLAIAIPGAFILTILTSFYVSIITKKLHWFYILHGCGIVFWLIIAWFYFDFILS